MLNQVALIGNMTKDPELRYAKNGTAVNTINIAINRKYKSGDENKEEVSYFEITCFGKVAENAAEYLAKGSKIAVSGRLKQNRWETESGDKRSKVTVVAESIVFLDGAKAKSKPAQKSEAPIDDDIPF